MESTIQLERTAGYTVLQNDLIRDSRLSLKTKGLFAVIASLPPNWKYSVQGLCTVAHVGRDAVKSALKELEQAGYLRREQQHDNSGKFASCAYILKDCSDSPLTEKPSTVEPPTVKPSAENPQLINKDISKERISNTPYSPPQGDGERRHRSPKSTPSWKPDRFEGLWKFYPEKGRKDRAAAVREWDRLQPDDPLIERIARTLQRQKQSDEWQRGIGIPYLCRYLSHQRWNDMVSQTPAAQPKGWETDPEVL